MHHHWMRGGLIHDLKVQTRPNEGQRSENDAIKLCVDVPTHGAL